MTNRVLPDNAILIPNDAKCVFKGEIFDVYQWQQEMYDGTFETFEMLRRSDTVIVIAVDGGEIVVLDEEQPNGVVRKNSLPAGRVDNTDETTLAAAKRELVEETGLQFGRWTLLEIIQPEHKLEWFEYVYIATEKVGEVEPKQDAGEKIIVKRVSFEEFKKRNEDKIKELRKISTIEQLIEKAKNS